MKQEVVTISRREYERLKRAAHVDRELVRKIRRGLEDIRQGRVREWKAH